MHTTDFQLHPDPPEVSQRTPTRTVEIGGAVSLKACPS